MGWAKLDDRFTEHPKVVGLSAQAVRLHVWGIVYCARNRTDGLIPAVMPRSWGHTAKHVGELVKGHLWEEVDGGYQVHDYLHYNPSRASIQEREKQLSGARSTAGKRGAAARWQQNGRAGGNADGKPPRQIDGTPDVGPRTRDDDDLSVLTDSASSSGYGTGGLPVLPWLAESRERLAKAGFLDSSEESALSAISADYGLAECMKAVELCEAANLLPFARNLRRHLIAEFGQPEWADKRKRQRYG